MGNRPSFSSRVDHKPAFGLTTPLLTTADGAKMKDGETVAADLVVLATGYKGQDHLVEQLFGFFEIGGLKGRPPLADQAGGGEIVRSGFLSGRRRIGGRASRIASPEGRFPNRPISDNALDLLPPTHDRRHREAAQQIAIAVEFHQRRAVGREAREALLQDAAGVLMLSGTGELLTWRV